MNYSQLEYLNDLFEEEVAAGRLFGAAVTVGTTGGRVFTGEYGDMKSNTLCMLCSMTKPITSIAAWVLIERGLLDPREKLSKYLPKYKNPVVYVDGRIVPAHREVTVLDVMNMVSGIPATATRKPEEDYSASMMRRMMNEHKARCDAGEKVPTWDLINNYGEIPLLFQPGERWDYGKNADVLGGVIEVISGISLGEFFDKEIFKPLGLADTGYIIPEEKLNRVGRIGKLAEDGTLKEITSQQFYGDSRSLAEEPYTYSGGGGNAPIMSRGVYSTLDDYSKICRMLLRKGELSGKRILSERTVELFAENQLTEQQRKGLFPGLHGYGYGSLMRVMMNRAEAPTTGSNGEFGWDGALGTYFCVDPEAGIYICYMQQKVADPIVRRKMRNIIYSAI